jgi:hypothetical protein
MTNRRNRAGGLAQRVWLTVLLAGCGQAARSTANGQLVAGEPEGAEAGALGDKVARDAASAPLATQEASAAFAKQEASVAADSGDEHVMTPLGATSVAHRYAGTGFVVHEWGTNTVVTGSDGSLQRGLHHEEEDLPDFVYDRAKQGKLLPVEDKMETPVDYFTPSELAPSACGLACLRDCSPNGTQRSRGSCRRCFSI